MMASLEQINLPKVLFDQLLDKLNDTEKENKEFKEKLLQWQQHKCSTGKAPLSRAKSEPVKAETKNTQPTFFVYPENKNRHERLIEQRVSGLQPPNQIDANKSGLRSLGDGEEQKGSFSELYSLKNTVPGVSNLIFQKAINELAKTKKHLHSVQIQQSIDLRDKQELERLRNESPKLQLMNKRLQAEMLNTRQEIARLRLEEEKRSKRELEKNDSFELETKEAPDQKSSHNQEQRENIDPQVLHNMEIKLEELKKENMCLGKELAASQYMGNTSQIEALVRERDELKSELMDMNREYDKIKDSERILSMCLEAAKSEQRKCEEDLKQSTVRTATLTQQLAKLRSVHEELRYDKIALEKELSITSSSERFPSTESKYLSSRAPSHGSNTSHSNNTHKDRSSPARPPLPERIPISHSSGLASFEMNISSPSSHRPKPPLNDLSISEKKLLNLAPANPPAFKCPRCLQNFHAENTYLCHLNKCVE